LLATLRRRARFPCGGRELESERKKPPWMEGGGRKGGIPVFKGQRKLQGGRGGGEVGGGGDRPMRIKGKDFGEEKVESTGR